MPFVYRLQKVLEFRIRAKEQQLLVVQKAQQDVYLQEEKIRQNEAEIRQTIQNKRTADFRMMEYYDNYLLSYLVPPDLNLFSLLLLYILYS